MKYVLLTILLLLCTITGAQAKNLDYTDFAKIPILHQGRIKPLDSFARIHLSFIADKTMIEGKTPIEWLAETLFDPESETRPLIKIIDPKLKKQLSLPKEQTRFSLHDLRQGLNDTRALALTLSTQDRPDPAGQQLLDIHEQAAALHHLHRSLSLLMPLTLNIPETYQKKYNITKDQPTNFLTLAPMQISLIRDTKNIIKRKGNNPENYTDNEKQIALLSYQIDQLRKDGTGNTLLRIIPPTRSATENEDWLSPWSHLGQNQGSPENAAYLALWQDMLTAFREKDTGKWNTATAKAREATQDITPSITSLEIFYNKARPFHLAMGLYGLCLLFCGAHFLYRGGISRVRPAPFWPQTALGAAVFCNIAGVIARMVILDRPPVSTLYESTIFVAAICGLFGLIIAQKTRGEAVGTIIRENKTRGESGGTPEREHLTRGEAVGTTVREYKSRGEAACKAVRENKTSNKSITLATAFTCLALLTLAPILIPRGESMEMLVAVLNTNFWLATHVVCITMGYGIAILSAGLAHIYLALRAFSTDEKRAKTMMRNIYTTALGALLLTAVGTVLGGIWADQSWGRFWGWDPKENGALLIVLWLIWTLHGRLSKHLRPLLFATTIAALNIIVAIAWFGVNLLSTGLHSYGFTSGMATGLATFCIAELLIIGTLYALARKNKGTSKNAP